MKNRNDRSIQEWFSFDMLKNKGIIKFKNNEYIKIMKVIPINYNLKSDLEKNAILNSYKTFLKTCNFDIQILIQSNKEDLSKHILKIQEKVKSENDSYLSNLSEKYIKFINTLNNEKKFSSKNFYIITKNEKKENLTEELIEMDLKEKYFKIRECLARCGNNVIEIEETEELLEIVNSFFNTRKNLMK